MHFRVNLTVIGGLNMIIMHSRVNLTIIGGDTDVILSTRQYHLNSDDKVRLLASLCHVMRIMFFIASDVNS